jgi:two-component system sensor histidine kinase BaeS
MKRLSIFFPLFAVLFTLAILGAFWIPTHDSGWKIILLLLLWLSGISLIGLIWYHYEHKKAWLARIINETANHPHIHQQSFESDDFTEVVQAVNQLGKRILKEEERRGQLIADVAHELRTPLTILRSQLETLVLEGKEVSIHQLIPLVDEIIHMQQLIHNLQQLSLAKANQITIKRSWFVFQEWLEEIIETLNIKAIEKEIEVKVEGKVSKEVYWDSSIMKQVVINLLGNAIKYTEQGGKVNIVLKQSQGIVKIQIIDNGPGIPPENFKRFYRVDASRSRVSGGSGLGLAIAKEFVELHGGSIYVESESGEGTTFTAILPIFPVD